MENDAVADVVFVIEGTAINGAYMHEMKSNYIVPTLEYFSQGILEDSEYLVSEQNSALYGIVLYRTAQAWPDEIVKTYGPYSNPKKVLQTIERLDLTGGKSESNANLAEGLATALVCFDDLKDLRPAEVTTVPKHCIVICNSAPYSMPVLECMQYENKTVEQLAAIVHERNINLSIIAPRKIPILFKLFMKADGDLPITAKNYSKDIRHLVLLKGYHLKERPLSPTTQIQAGNATNSIQPTPMDTNQLQQQQQQQPHMNQQQQQFPNPNNPQPTMPSNFNSNVNQVNRWHFQNQQQQQQQQQQQRLPYSGMPGQQNTNSALISQLSAPPNQPSNPMMQQQQQSIRMQLMNQQQQQQQQQQPLMQQGAPVQGQPQQQQQHNPVSGPSDGSAGRDREKIWSGVLEWIEKPKPDQQKVVKQVPCHVTANIKDGEPEIKADNWPPQLLMQLMPKHIVGNIGGQYLKESKIVIFRPNNSEAMESLAKVMTSGFAGCVHITTNSVSSCDIKVLILLYTAEKKTFLGFIPNNQTIFVERLRNLIQQKQERSNNKQQTPLMVGSAMANTHPQQQQQIVNPQKQIPMDPNVMQMQQEQQQQQQQQHYNSYPQIQPMQMSDSMQPNMAMMQQGQPQQQMPPRMPGQQQQVMHPQNPQAMVQQQQQRMVRPIMNTNSGLRHLLQQQTAPGVNQFRPNMPQMNNPNMGGGQNMGLPNRPNTFDDNNFDFMLN